MPCPLSKLIINYSIECCLKKVAFFFVRCHNNVTDWDIVLLFLKFIYAHCIIFAALRWNIFFQFQISSTEDIFSDNQVQYESDDDSSFI